MANRPTGRKKNVTGSQSSIHREEQIGGGPVGMGGSHPSGGSNGSKRALIGGGAALPVIIIMVVLMMLKGGGNQDMDVSYSGDSGQNTYTQSQSTNSGGSAVGNVDLQSLLSGGYHYSEPAPASQTSYSSVDTTVAEGARAKRTVIRGNGMDTVTLMVYMCGTDLESKYGMATNDLREMASARFGDNINIIVYTGGCNAWKTNGISNSKNQIYRVKSGGLECLVADDGAKAMTSPDTLSNFIRFCAQNYPADRYDLIMWDHGGGSVSGYGYDEKYKSAGSMGLANIGKALKAGGVTFDFIGFDACLMATAETALLLDNYADYMIASEETEPGIGWYYTNWLTKLGENTSMPTLEIGKMIVDDFVATCGQQCRGQKTTLSVTDLAEFAHTVPDNISSFSKSVTNLIADNKYEQVSNARYTTREFAQSTKIDQVDLADLADKVGTNEGRELKKSICSAVKYNRTSSDISNAYGISIYFPYKRSSYVDPACSEYSQIGFDDDYADCIRKFASMEACGQAAHGGDSMPISSLFGSLGGDSTASLLGSLLSGGFDMISGLDSSNSSFLSDRAMPDEDIESYISLNSLSENDLVWSAEGSDDVLYLTDEQWALVHDLDVNIFYDDGEGYIDLGLDNPLTFNDKNGLVCDKERTWIALNGSVCAYYHTDTTAGENGMVYTGYIPVLIDGERMRLIVVFEGGSAGRVVGVQHWYSDETNTVDKTADEIADGTEIKLICDYYSYDKQFQSAYTIGTVTKNGDLQVSDMVIENGKMLITYRLTDIYDNKFWTPTIESLE